ncbi:MAG: LytTR family DNA-binding domain-containing protein [Oscillospiraceae bacterium]|nr:LytTR family DNA-binding domain-containing protein [Oscillospiraceae bacterium]MCL2278821.1 LytTR family DNA-binding domain-containing protein [Oscillospiraceae bacterium]
MKKLVKTFAKLIGAEYNYSTLTKGDGAVRIAVCDDERSFRGKMCNAIGTYDDLPTDVSIEEFSCGKTLIAGHNKSSFDIIFLDIEMGETNGFEAGRKIRSNDHNVIIILVTNHKSFMQDAFKIEVFDYITKPYEAKDIHEVLKRALRKHCNQHFKVELKWRGNTHMLNIGDIIYVRIEDRNLVFVTKGKTHELRCIGKLDHYEGLLRPYDFFRCHKSYLVNMGLIAGFKGKTIIMANGSVVNVSARKKQDFLGAYNEYATKYKV